LLGQAPVVGELATKGKIGWIVIETVDRSAKGFGYIDS
jgi:hypothetical protein